MNRPPATAGGFLRAAATQLDLAGKQCPSRAEVREAASAFGLALASLERYLNGGILAGRRREAAADARAHLGRSARLLKADSLVVRLPGARRGPLAEALTSAARSLTAARDLLHTHFTLLSDGVAAHRSHWAPVIESPEVARALAAEVADCAGRLEPIAGGWARAAAGWSDFARESRAFATAHEALRETRAAIGGPLASDPATAGDRALLYAIPVNAPIPPAPPQAAETVGSICHAIVLTAERARQATWAPRYPWAADNSEVSLRRTGEAATVASHNCEVVLDMLAECARTLGSGALAESLTRSRGAAFAARSRWVDVAQRWNGQVVTVSEAGPEAVGPSFAADELAVWTGRLVFADPAWVPGQGRRGVPRVPEELAGSEDAVARVVAAIHHSADALHRIAESELAQTRVIGETGQMYVPAWSVPPESRSAGLYCPAPPSRIRELVRSYEDAEASTARLAETMDLAVGPARAPSQVLVLARTAVGRAADPSAETREPTERPGRKTPGPVVRLLKDKGINRPKLLAMAEELDEVARRPGAPERQLVLRRTRRSPRTEVKREHSEMVGRAHREIAHARERLGQSFPQVAQPDQPRERARRIDGELGQLVVNRRAADAATGPGCQPGAGVGDRDAGARQEPGRTAVARSGQRGRTAGRETDSARLGASSAVPAIQAGARREDDPSQRIRELQDRRARDARPLDVALPVHGDQGAPLQAQTPQSQPEALPNESARVVSRSGGDVSRPWREPRCPQPRSTPAVQVGRQGQRQHEPWTTEVPGVLESPSADWPEQVIRSGVDRGQPGPVRPFEAGTLRSLEHSDPDIGR